MTFDLLHCHIPSVPYFALEDQGDNEIEIGLESFQKAFFGKFQGK
jgi:hypothetical protein